MRTLDGDLGHDGALFQRELDDNSLRTRTCPNLDVVEAAARIEASDILGECSAIEALSSTGCRECACGLAIVRRGSGKTDQVKDAAIGRFCRVLVMDVVAARLCSSVRRDR